METLKYKVIKNSEQYNKYCNELIQMLESEKPDQYEDEIDLLTVLIEAYDAEHSTFTRDYDPVEMLQSLMADHKMKAKDLAELLNVSKSYVSEILHYKKGMSKEVIRKLAERFAMRQEAFNRPYKLISDYPVMQEEEEVVAE
jgi:HTH-type transcriptional regulator / antitoxin HigA